VFGYLENIYIQKDHSMDNLVIILNKIAEDFENASKGISNEDADDPVEIDEPGNTFDDLYSGSNFSADDRWFILCGRPHGSVSLIPTLLTIAAFFCAAVGNNTCALFIRELDNGEVFHSMTNGLIEDVAGLTLGLYAYGVEFHHTDDDDYVLQCSPNLPDDIKDDSYIKLARGFSVLALVIGFPVMCFLSLANCMMLSRKSFRRIAVSLLFVTCFQSMMFLFLLSERCHSDNFPNLPDEVNLKSCHLNSGSKMSLSSCVMWFLSAVLTAYIDRASVVEGQLKLLSMHAVAAASH